MTDYRSPDSIPEKQRLVEELYGDEVPGYMLFHIGRTNRLSEAEEQMLNETFFDGRTPGFGDKEFHHSHAFTGSYLDHPSDELQPFVVLRIRGASRMAYFVEIGGMTCHLIQVEDTSGRRKVNFMNLWGPSPQDAVKIEGCDDFVQTPSDPFGRPTAFVPDVIPILVLAQQEPPRQRGRFARFISWLVG